MFILCINSPIQTLEALVTNSPNKEDIAFTIVNQANAAGVVPTETLIEVTQSDDGKWRIIHLVTH